MRQIKYRLWRKDTQTMLAHETLVNNNWYERLGLPDENLVWMQFTGLLAQANTEIYEGDLVRLFYIPSEFKAEPFDVFEVIWYGSGFRFAVLPKKIRIFPCEKWDSNEISVIGNIYKNKDALKEKQI